MASGGSRANSGPAPDPMSFRSMNKDWVELPAAGFKGRVPAWPLAQSELHKTEMAFWKEIWKKPQAFMWNHLGLGPQVASYVRAYVESTAPGAATTLKTAVLRMETELGISIAGMRQNGWKMGAPAGAVKTAARPKTPTRQTSTGSWLKDVSIEGG